MLVRIGTTLLAAALLGAGCAGQRTIDTVMPEAESPADSIYVETFNDNFYEARVHAIWGGGMRRPMGTIPGNGGHSEVALPWEPRELVFEISFIVGGTTYVTHPIDAIRGEHLELRLPPNIDASGFFRRVISRD